MCYVGDNYSVSEQYKSLKKHKTKHKLTVGKVNILSLKCSTTIRRISGEVTISSQ